MAASYLYTPDAAFSAPAAAPMEADNALSRACRSDSAAVREVDAV